MAADGEGAAVRTCDLCCMSLPSSDFHSIWLCGCTFCKNCLKTYITVAVRENMIAPNIVCPDPNCPRIAMQAMTKKQSIFSLRNVFSQTGLSSPSSPAAPSVAHNVISSQEIEALVDGATFGLYKKLKLEYEVDRDPDRVWCPSPNCDMVCVIAKIAFTSIVSSGGSSNFSLSSLASPTTAITTSLKSRQASGSKALPFYCPKCDKSFCSECRRSWHMGFPCARMSADESLLVMLQREGTINSDQNPLEIKRCPRCSVWIERDEGCAQMLCRKCKHVFCWFCLQSLEDDFLLRHYDRGPCKNKLGHTRASVIWHRTQVIGIFAGFGVLLLLASPLFLLAAPCVLCCNCCSTPCQLLQEEDIDDEIGEATPMNASVAIVDSHLSSPSSHSTNSTASSVFRPPAVTTVAAAATGSSSSRKLSLFRSKKKNKSTIKKDKTSK